MTTNSQILLSLCYPWKLPHALRIWPEVVNTDIIASQNIGNLDSRSPTYMSKLFNDS